MLQDVMNTTLTGTSVYLRWIQMQGLFKILILTSFVVLLLILRSKQCRKIQVLLVPYVGMYTTSYSAAYIGTIVCQKDLTTCAV
jgi:hypothetical protein